MVLPLICSSSSLFYHCLQVAWKCRGNASAHTFASCILEGSLAALLRFTHVQLAFFVAGAALCEHQSADFVAGTNLHAQMSWQAQHFVNLDAPMSWQARRFTHLQLAFLKEVSYEMRF